MPLKYDEHFKNNVQFYRFLFDIRKKYTATSKNNPVYKGKFSCHISTDLATNAIWFCLQCVCQISENSEPCATKMDTPTISDYEEEEEKLVQRRIRRKKKR